jgi:hypothetical protein
MSEAAILREYERLASEDPNFGLEGKKKRRGYQSGYYDLADEIIEQTDDIEYAMNNMLKYVDEVSDLIKGQDLQSISQMMEVTKDTMSHHFDAFDRFKTQIDDINAKADAAINALNFYDTNPDSSLNTSKSDISILSIPAKKKAGPIKKT